eukprot:1682086-Prorocentrum_lima.AAC.1
MVLRHNAPRKAATAHIGEDLDQLCLGIRCLGLQRHGQQEQVQGEARGNLPKPRGCRSRCWA